MTDRGIQELAERLYLIAHERPPQLDPKNEIAYQLTEFLNKENPTMDQEQTDPVFNLGIGSAIHAMRQGRTAARKGWNGKDMFIFLVPGSNFKVSRPPLNVIYPEGTEISYQPHVDMKTVGGSIVPWLCSQSDLLAQDWGIVE